MHTVWNTTSLIMAALALVAVAFLVAVKPAGAEAEPRLSLSAAVTDCDAYEVTVTPSDLLEGESYRIVTQYDFAPFGTWQDLETTDIGDSEDSLLVEAGELPVDVRYRATIEILVGDDWIPATGPGGEFVAVAVLEYAQDAFCPEPTEEPEPTEVPTEEPTEEPTAEPEPTETPEPTATSEPPPTPVVIVVEHETVVVNQITPPSTGSAGVR